MKFSLPQLRPTAGGGTTGLVIRSGAVELLSLQGDKVATRLSVPIEGKDDGALASAIQKACEAGRVTGKKLPVSFLTQDVLFRFFTMPTVPQAERETAVQFEVRKYIPFKTDTLVWDCYILPGGDGNKLEVVFAAMQRDTFVRLHTALASAGIQPSVMEPRSLSLARLTESPKGSMSNDFVCLVDVEGTAAHLVIAKNGVPYLARDVHLPLAPPVPDPAMASPVAAGESSDPQGQRLLSELSVSMDFFTREYPSAGISRIWLFGDEQRIGPWCAWFADQLRCPAAMGQPLLASRVTEPIELSFASAVGLLQAGKTRGGAALNFMKRLPAKTPAQAQRPEPAAALMAMLSTESLLASLKSPQMALVGMACAVLVFGMWFVGGQHVSSERRRLEQLTQAQPKFGWGLETRNKAALEPMRKEASMLTGVLTQLLEQRVSAAAKLDALARSLSDGMWLNELSYDDKIELSGKSQLRLMVKGACYLGEAGREATAMFEFENRIKHHPVFSKGFGVTRLEEVRTQGEREGQYAYGTFALNCASDRRL